MAQVLFPEVLNVIINPPRGGTITHMEPELSPQMFSQTWKECGGTEKQQHRTWNLNAPPGS